MTAKDVIAKYLEDAYALHPGHMTASGLLARLADAGYKLTPGPVSVCQEHDERDELRTRVDELEAERLELRAQLVEQIDCDE